MREIQTIRDFYRKILGYIEIDGSGNKVARDFYRQIVARYDAKQNVTRDYYGRIIGNGDLTAAMLYSK